MFRRVFIIVLDSVGIGNARDAQRFGDEGAHTLKSVMTANPRLDNLANLGLFNIGRAGLTEYGVNKPAGFYGYAEERSNGKDTTLGHWEIAGLVSETALPVYPNGFPKEIIEKFEAENGVEVICNLPYSGTEVIKDYGEEHLKTGKIIVYTSADSVFQIAAHEDMVPLWRLYEMCESARKILCGEHAVGRVIARPFAGEIGSFYRTGGRHDYSLTPFGDTMLDLLKAKGLDVISVGKINDIFASRGVTESHPTKGNAEGIERLFDIAKRDFCGLCFVNLVDFDSSYGHRNDIKGYARALEQFDVALGGFLPEMRDDDLIIITADHGCDPGFKGTDHTRENVPIIAYYKGCNGGDLGGFDGYGCIAKTVCDNFKIDNLFPFESFMGDIEGRQQIC
ncbi:MAG: phosphopentomutase [Clostridia bacterium]|nr:phosphopentomutase [Clostridia bacterium]